MASAAQVLYATLLLWLPHIAASLLHGGVEPVTVRALEADAILQALAGKARTVPGARFCATLPLASSAAEARAAYAAVGEAMALTEEQLPPLGHSLATVVPALEAEEHTLRDLAGAAEAVVMLKSLAAWSHSPPTAAPLLADLAARAAPPERLASRFCAAFEADPAGANDGAVRLSSAAFPVLKQRRAALAKAEASLSRAVAQLVDNGGLSSIVSEADATPQRREGRMVVPVRPANKRAAGIEVGASRSGRTVYVEPHALAPHTAACRAAQAALTACEARLLVALGELLRTHAAPLCEAVEAAAEVDAVLARASLGASWHGVIPTVGGDGCIIVRDARHPLLALKASAGGGASAEARVTGNSLALHAAARDARGEEGGREAGAAGSLSAQGLMLTGPNGGGKSVVLKTAALYALLNRMAIPLPCAPPTAARPEPPRVDFFDSITTDLADAQSLSDGASSFAAHLRSCRRALTAAEAVREGGGHAMVVLDEPGAATDPTQGAAIARAVIEQLLDDGAVVLAATHSDALKAYGLSDSRLMTAAMARAADGSPLFTLVPGAIGSSHALDAAQRERLPPAILRRAAELLPDHAHAHAADGPDGAAESVQGALIAQTEALAVALQSRLEEAESMANVAAAAAADAEAAKTQARAAARVAARSLDAARAFLGDRVRALDGMIGRLKSEGATGLELSGETVRTLRLVEREASEARAGALAALGLAPLTDDARLVAGQRLTYVPSAGAGEEAVMEAVMLEAVVDDDAAPYDANVKVAVEGAPPAYVPRAELATWFGGAADDFEMDADAWAWMATGTAGLQKGVVASSANGVSAAGGRRRRRR